MTLTYNINIYFCVIYYIYNIIIYPRLMKKEKEETEKIERQNLKKWLMVL